MSDEFNLAHEIWLRIAQPSVFVGDRRTLLSEEPAYAETEGQWQARAVAALFDTAEPAADSKLRTIDLPAELEAAAKELRDYAATFLEGEFPSQRAADRAGFLANCVEETSHLIVEPARMLSVLMHDRDQWQTLKRQAEEQLAVTEAALAVSQKSNVALAEGQSKLIGLLERVARQFDPPMELHVGKVADDAAMMIDGIVPLGTFTYRVATEIQKVIDAHAPECLPDIYAVLSQVTAIETDAAGRLSVAAQPATEPAKCPPEICAECGGPNDRPGKSVWCTKCIPF